MPTVINFGHSQLTLEALGKILQILDWDGCVTVEGICPGGANPFFMGISLREFAEKLEKGEQ